MNQLFLGGKILTIAIKNTQNSIILVQNSRIIRSTILEETKIIILKLNHLESTHKRVLTFAAILAPDKPNKSSNSSGFPLLGTPVTAY